MKILGTLLATLILFSCATVRDDWEIQRFGDNDVVRLDGRIDDDMTKQVVSAIRDVDAKKKLVLMIDSPGGAIDGMWKIMAALQERQGENECIVTGGAFSAAGVIFESKGCTERIMEQGTLLMIHLPSSVAMGNEVDMQKEIETLVALKIDIFEILKFRVGEKLAGVIISIIETDHPIWVTPEQAIRVKLADRVL